MQEAADLGHGESVTGQLDSGLELSSLMSRSSAFRSETEDHEFGGSPTKLTSLAARNPALNFHYAPVRGGMLAAGVVFVFCEQMSLLLSIKKSWSIFCFRWLSNCLEVTSSHSNTTWLLPIMSNPLRLKPCVIYHVWDTCPVLPDKFSGS